MGAPVYDRKVRPSGWWYAAAGMIAVGGIVAGLAVAVKGVDDALEAIRSFDRTPVPGVVDVQITEPGGYSIYQEFPGAADRGATTSPPDVVVTDPNGAPVDLKDYGTFISYDQGTLEGRGVYTFRADQAGTFHIAATGGSGSTIAVGRGMGDLSTRAVAGAFGGVIGGAILSMAGIATAIVVAITTGITRGRSRRRQRIYLPAPLAPLAGAPTPAMATWSAAPITPGWQPLASSPHPNGSPRPAWPNQQATTAKPTAPTLTGTPAPAGSPGRSGASPTAGPVTRIMPADVSVPLPASPSPAPAEVAVPSGASAPGPALPPPGAGTRVMASTGAAVGVGPVTRESTLVGPAPTLVQVGTAEGSAPTEPLSRPGDPQSLRSPVDWSRSDLELPWESDAGS